MTATESKGRGMTTKKQEKTFWAIVVFQLCNLSKHIQELLRACSVVTDFFVTPWTEAYQAPLFMGFSRQEDWNGLPLPSPKYCLGISDFLEAVSCLALLLLY